MLGEPTRRSVGSSVVLGPPSHTGGPSTRPHQRHAQTPDDATPAERYDAAARPLLILGKPAINDRLPLIHLRRRPLRRLPFERHRRNQRRSNIAAVNPELPRQRPDRLRLLRRMRTTDRLVELHLRPLYHPHRPPRSTTPVADPADVKVGPNQMSTTAPSGARSDKHTQQHDDLEIFPAS